MLRLTTEEVAHILSNRLKECLKAQEDGPGIEERANLAAAYEMFRAASVPGPSSGAFLVSNKSAGWSDENG